MREENHRLSFKRVRKRKDEGEDAVRKRKREGESAREKEDHAAPS